jgi:O-antigen/teichoic acid export membrane protein
MSQELGRKVRTSILALQGRQAAILAVNIGVGIILARKLGPEIFGIYAIATFCLSLITMTTDFGLAGSLVQRKGVFGEHEISVAFTLQSAIALVAASLLWLLAPLSLLVYRTAPHELVWVIRSLSLSVLLSPIGTTARLQLEREIQFHKIATIDISAMLVGNAVLLSMVFSGMGVWSFVAGNVANALTTSIGSWLMIRYRPRFVLDRKLVRELLSFGMFFQFGNITNEAAGWIIPLISGASLGPAAVGLLTWASSNGRRPLMVVDNVMRVAFPHFSRLQEHPEELASQVGLYFRRLLLLCYAWAFLAILLGAPMTHIVYTDKWMPGVVALQLFAIGLSMDVVNWVGGMTLTALGGVKETAKWTLVKSLLAISGAFAGVHVMGIVGIPIASIAASLISGAGLLIQLRKRIPLGFRELWMPSLPFLLAGLAYLPLWLCGGLAGLVGRWGLGIAMIGWTAWRGYREFIAGRIARQPAPEESPDPGIVERGVSNP